MAEYLILIYEREEDYTAAPPELMAEVMAAHDRFGEQFADKIVGSRALQDTVNATSIRNDVVTDGPFAETREQLGGFFMIEAANLDEALTIASRIPAAQFGTIEVRPLLEIPGLPRS